ncbi:hypothetical protein CRV24_008322 [Beauveria bassiana]|nr:hypothetical protein CRV24_008322 [Beauveria bassiana]
MDPVPGNDSSPANFLDKGGERQWRHTFNLARNGSIGEDWTGRRVNVSIPSFRIDNTNSIIANDCMAY